MIKTIAFSIYAVADIGRARDFYEKTLGLKVAETFGDKWIEYDLGGATFVITDAFAASPQSSVAFEIDEFDAEIARLKAASVRFQGEPNDFPGCRMVLINDPDGHTICLHHKKP